MICHHKLESYPILIRFFCVILLMYTSYFHEGKYWRFMTCLSSYAHFSLSVCCEIQCVFMNTHVKWSSLNLNYIWLACNMTSWVPYLQLRGPILRSSISKRLIWIQLRLVFKYVTLFSVIFMVNFVLFSCTKYFLPSACCLSRGRWWDGRCTFCCCICWWHWCKTTLAVSSDMYIIWVQC